MSNNDQNLAPLRRVKIFFNKPEVVEEKLTTLYFQIQGCEIEKQQFIPFEDSEGNKLVFVVIIYINKNPVG